MLSLERVRRAMIVPRSTAVDRSVYGCLLCLFGLFFFRAYRIAALAGCCFSLTARPVGQHFPFIRSPSRLAVWVNGGNRTTPDLALFVTSESSTSIIEPV